MALPNPFIYRILLLVSPAEFDQINPRICAWHRFASSLKSDLFSTALATATGLFLIDPTPLSDSELNQLPSMAPIAGIFVTNANHLRASDKLSERFWVPLVAHEKAFLGQKPARFTAVEAGGLLACGVDVIKIEGAADGELAIYDPQDGGTLIVGDALINFEPHGFTFLPRKYCLNEKTMRRSLRQLLAKPAERLLFAHGTPIVSGASVRLRELLEAA